MNTPAILTVSQLNTYVRSLLEGDPNLSDVFVCGEISNFTDHYRSGHLYFSLKDEKSVIRAVMFARSAARLRFRPADGMRVIARGRVSVYEVSGQYQFYAEDMQPDGLGALELAFEQLKAKLGAEGLFAPERKRPIPPYPERIGVITSPTGAAVHDIQTVLARRYPLASVVFCPVLVQGEGAAPQIVDALERFSRLRCADVIILGRGGGSLEDLWPFNEESVARAVASCAVPVISAVGHETDFTICDFVADLRAPTPSAAAELAVPDRRELLNVIADQRLRMYRAASASVSEGRSRLDALTASRALRSPMDTVESGRMAVDRLAERMRGASARKMSEAKAALSASAGRLSALSPLAVLARGYSVARKGGIVISSIKSVVPGDSVDVVVSDGKFSCTVNEIEKCRENEQKAGAAEHESENDV